MQCPRMHSAIRLSLAVSVPMVLHEGHSRCGGSTPTARSHSIPWVTKNHARLLPAAALIPSIRIELLWLLLMREKLGRRVEVLCRDGAIGASVSLPLPSPPLHASPPTTRSPPASAALGLGEPAGLDDIPRGLEPRASTAACSRSDTPNAWRTRRNSFTACASMRHSTPKPSVKPTLRFGAVLSPASVRCSQPTPSSIAAASISSSTAVPRSSLPK